MEKLPALFFDGLDNSRMTVSGHVHSYPSHEVQKPVAIHIHHHGALSPIDD